MRTTLRRVQRERSSPGVVWLLCLALLTVGILPAAAPSDGATTERVSVANDGTQPNRESENPSISADGRFVVFDTAATTIVPGDMDYHGHVFIYDRATGTVEKIGTGLGGAEPDWDNFDPAISGDGAHVAFASCATNLISGDTNGKLDVFVMDRDTRVVQRVSVASNGDQGNDDSYRPSISANGRYVAFCSLATNLVAGDTNGATDIFVHDCETGETERANVASDGTQADGESETPAISADGRRVAFSSGASSLASGDPSGDEDVYVHDRVTGETERISETDLGAPADDRSFEPSISCDGRYVVFLSAATNLVPGDTNLRSDVFVRDRLTGETERVSMAGDGGQANDHVNLAVISPDGRYVAFESLATNLLPDVVAPGGGVYIRDCMNGEIWPANVATDGTWGNEGAFVQLGMALSFGGRAVAFCSMATNLVPGDTNGWADVFVHDRGGPSFADIPPCHWAHDAVISCAEANVVTGYDDSLYHPELSVTRDQMAVYISRALAGGDGNVPDFTGTTTFPDVPVGFWALDYVEYAVAQNVVAGYDDGSYHPGYEVTRDQMAVYVARSLVAPTGEAALADYVPSDPRNFPDVLAGFWAWKHVEYCVEQGVVSGYEDGLYHPEEVVTRDQMAVYIARAFRLL